MTCLKKYFDAGDPRSDKGYVLLVTLLVTSILVAVFVEFAYGVYISSARAAAFASSQRAALLAGNGVELARSAVEELARTRPNMVIDDKGFVFSKREGDAVIEIRIFDELGKASLRTVYRNTGARDEKAYGIYSRLLKNLGLDAPGLENPLADWIDSDNEPRMHGAEELDHYAALRRKYAPRNSYLETTEELYMIKGYDPDSVLKLLPFVSAYNANGDININTAPKEVLMSLSDEMTESLAQRIIDYRRDTPFKDRSNIMKIPGFEKTGFALQDRITVTSDTYRIQSRVTDGETAREVEAVIRTNKGILYWRES